MGKTTTAAEFVLTANNRTGVAFGQLGASFRQAKADAEKYSAAANRAGRAGAGGVGGRSGGGGSMLGGMGRFLAPAAAFAGVRNVMQMGDEIGDQADSMQVSAETFQTLQVLARDTSVSVGGLGKAFASLNEKKVEALADETSAAAEAFQKLNMSKPLFAMNTEELFEAVAATMRSTTSTASQLAAAQDLLGQSATKLMPVYQALAGTSLAELNKQLVESGRIIDEHGIKKISEMDSKYQAALDKLKTFGGKRLVDAVEFSSNRAQSVEAGWSEGLGKWARNTGEYYMQKARQGEEQSDYFGLTDKYGKKERGFIGKYIQAEVAAPFHRSIGAPLLALGDMLDLNSALKPERKGFEKNDLDARSRPYDFAIRPAEKIVVKAERTDQLLEKAVSSLQNIERGGKVSVWK